MAVEKLAVGSEPGFAQLHLGEMDIAPRAASNREWETITVSTLDSLEACHGVTRYVKIDVEGYEPDVLLGLSQAIAIVSFEVQGPAIHMAADCVDILDRPAPYKFSVHRSISMV